MNKNALITVIILIVVAAIGWFVYAGNDQTMQTMNDSVIPADTNNNNTTNQSTSVGTPNNTTDPATSAPKTVEITVRASNYKFDLSTINVKKGDTVKLTLINDVGVHDLKFEGYNIGTKILQGVGQDTLTFVADKAGDFEYYCSVGNHRAMGMKGTLRVTS